MPKNTITYGAGMNPSHDVGINSSPEEILLWLLDHPKHNLYFPFRGQAVSVWVRATGAEQPALPILSSTVENMFMQGYLATDRHGNILLSEPGRVLANQLKTAAQAIEDQEDTNV